MFTPIVESFLTTAFPSPSYTLLYSAVSPAAARRKNSFLSVPSRINFASAVESKTNTSPSTSMTSESRAAFTRSSIPAVCNSPMVLSASATTTPLLAFSVMLYLSPNPASPSLYFTRYTVLFPSFAVINVPLYSLPAESAGSAIYAPSVAFSAVVTETTFIISPTLTFLTSLSISEILLSFSFFRMSALSSVISMTCPSFISPIAPSRVLRVSSASALRTGSLFPTWTSAYLAKESVDGYSRSSSSVTFPALL